MRVLRTWLLLVALLSATWLLTSVAVDPFVTGWRVVRATDAQAHGTSAAELTALLTGGYALLAALAWLWLLASVGACAWEVLRAGPVHAAPSKNRTGAGSLLRPRAVRVVVAAALGVGALTAGTAQAAPPADSARTLPDQLPSTAGDRSVAPSVVTLRLLDGLPLPDRVAGGEDDRSRGLDPDRARGRAPDGARAVDRTVRVAPGDCLWSLAARLLPQGSPTGTVANGWRLLYAANREVVGPDPDLVHPGQVLRIDAALDALVEAAPSGRTTRAHQAGGSR